MVAVAYATPDEVRSAVARDLSKTTGTAASLDDDELKATIVTAQAEVDAKLRGRYTLPFTTVPLLVKSIVIDIASYLATLTYRQSKDLAQGDPIMLRYDRAEKLLKSITDGTADLDTGDGGAAAGSTSGGAGQPINPYTGNLFGLEDAGLSYGRDRWRW